MLYKYFVIENLGDLSFVLLGCDIGVEEKFKYFIKENWPKKWDVAAPQSIGDINEMLDKIDLDDITEN